MDIEATICLEVAHVQAQHALDHKNPLYISYAVTVWGYRLGKAGQVVPIDGIMCGWIQPLSLS